MSGADLHLVLHIFGQKNLTFFPVTGSFFLHRCLGFAETHLLHSLFSSLLNRKVTLSSHSPRSLVVGADVGDVLGDLDVHLVSQIFGQKYLTLFPVAGSFLMQRLAGLSETHVPQCLPCLLLKRKVLLSSHSPRVSVGEVVGNADTVGDGVVAVADASEGADDKESDGLDDVSSVGITVGDNVVGISLGYFVGVRVGFSVGVRVGFFEGVRVGFFVGVRVGFFIGEIVGDPVFSPPFPFPLLFSLLLLFPLLFSPPFPFPLLFSLLLLFESVSELLLLFESVSETLSLLLLFELLFALFPLFDSRALLPIDLNSFELFLDKRFDPIDGDALLMMMNSIIVIVVVILAIMILSWLLILFLFFFSS
jgi:hypothetical protein